MDGPSEALAFSIKTEAGYKCRQKLDQTPLENLLFKFRRSGEGDARGSCRPLPFARVWVENPRR